MMNCPECSQKKLRVTDTFDFGDHRRRYHICTNCGARPVTIERFAVFVSRGMGYAEVPVDLSDLAPSRGDSSASTPPAGAAKAKARPQARGRFRLSGSDDSALQPIQGQICSEALPLIVQWWNESRWQKHGSKAVWSRTAFQLAANRVASLAPGLQVDLCLAGVEHGWQTLKYEYIREQLSLTGPNADALRNPASQEALAGVRAWQAG
jgi:hypothetical protein